MTKTTMIFPEFSLRFVDFAVFLSREAVQVMLDGRHLKIIRNRYTGTGSVPIYVKNVHVRMYVAILIKITRRVNAQGSVTIVYKDGGRRQGLLLFLRNKSTELFNKVYQM